MTNKTNFWVFGKNTVLDIIKNQKNNVLEILLDSHEKIKKLPDRYKKKITINKKLINRLNTSKINHQGFAANISFSNQKIKKKINNKNIVVLDGITDQGNIGAIIRAAAAFNFEKIIIDQRYFKKNLERIYKNASGATDQVEIIKTPNIKYELKKLKEDNYYVLGFDEKSDSNYFKNINQIISENEKLVFIVGSETHGIKNIVRNMCNLIVNIPINKSVNSLNVSNALSAALAIYSFCKASRSS